MENVQTNRLSAHPLHAANSSAKLVPEISNPPVTPDQGDSIPLFSFDETEMGKEI